MRALPYTKAITKWCGLSPPSSQVNRLVGDVREISRLVVVAAFGGLRWGELAGLRRKRVDLERGTVTVAEQLVEVNGAFSVGPPKSAAGRRTVVLPAAVVAALAEHLADYTEASPDA